MPLNLDLEFDLSCRHLAFALSYLPLSLSRETSAGGCPYLCFGGRGVFFFRNA